MEDTQRYKRFVFDEPSLLNLRQPPLEPLNNQYSILNHTRNPYYMFDPLALELNYRVKPQKILQNDSLNMEIKHWRKKQMEKQNSVVKLQEKISQLSKLVKEKETSSKNAISFPYGQIGMPMPMMLPFMSSGSCHGNSCNHCQCRSTCMNSCIQCCHQNKELFIIRQPKTQQPKRYHPNIISNRYQNKSPASPKLTKRKRMMRQKEQNFERKPEGRGDALVGRVQKKGRRNLCRRWRICTIAIYFCIYFRQFSKQFTLNRYNDFKYKYLLDGGQEITKNYKDVYNQLLKLNIPSLVRDSASKIRQSNIASQKKDIAFFLKSQNALKLSKIKKYTLLSQNIETLFLRCGQFLVALLKDAQKLLNDWQWGEAGYGMGVGCLNKSFLIDKIFLPHQIFMMRFHGQKGYLSMDGQGQRILLMTKLCVKILLFNVCLQIDNNKQWFQMFKEDVQQREDISEIFIILQISSKILFIICQSMFQICTDKKQSNYSSVENKFKIQPCNHLVYAHSIKRRRELFKNEDVKDSDLLIYGLEKIDEVNDAMNGQYFDVVEKKIQNQLNRLIEETLAKIKSFNKKKYQQIWIQTLNSEYIVLRGINNVMKSNRYYPYTSVSALPSKKSAGTKYSVESTMKGIQEGKRNDEIKGGEFKSKSSKFGNDIRNGSKISIENNMGN